MDLSIYTVLIICFMTFLAGFIDSIAGGGGLITLPAYLSVGLPPHLAFGTNKFSAFFGTGVAFVRYLKGGKVSLKPAIASALGALPGSYIGAQLTLLISEAYLRYILIALIPIIMVIVFTKKNFGTEDTSSRFSTKRLVLLSFLAGLVIGAYDGFFGPGTGTFLILAYTGLMGFSMTVASGNAKLVNFASNIGALIAFVLAGKVVYMLAIPAALTNIFGNWLGSGLAVKNGAKVIRPIFLIVVLLLFIKLVYDLVSGK